MIRGDDQCNIKNNDDNDGESDNNNKDNNLSSVNIIPYATITITTSSIVLYNNI